jgi:hypothetical protein
MMNNVYATNPNPQLTFSTFSNAPPPPPSNNTMCPASDSNDTVLMMRITPAPTDFDFDYHHQRNQDLKDIQSSQPNATPRKTIRSRASSSSSSTAAALPSKSQLESSGWI